MKLLALRKIHQGKFITYYEADYENDNKMIKTYEFVSRDPSLTKETFGLNKPAGVGMVCFSLDKSKVLLESEFRLACNRFVFNFPAGLIDKGETPEQAAQREIREETGVEMKEIIDVLSPCYALPGSSDELMVIVIGKCEGEIQKSCYVDEEINAKWYTKEEVRKLLKDGEYMSARTQMFLYQWVNEK